MALSCSDGLLDGAADGALNRMVVLKRIFGYHRMFPVALQIRVHDSIKESSLISIYVQSSANTHL